MKSIYTWLQLPYTWEGDSGIDSLDAIYNDILLSVWLITVLQI